MGRRLFASLSLMLMLGLGAQVMAAEPLDRIVAVINDDAIMASELENRVIQMHRQLASRGIEAPDETALRRQVLDRMIVEQIQLQMAEQANLSVDDTELNRALRSIAEDNDMSLDEFADTLEADGLSLAMVRDQVRREMLMRELQQRRVASRINISEREVDRYLDNQGDNANVRYRLGHILVALPQSPSQAQVQQAREKVQSLRRQLQNGADFADVAAASSDGANALKGGDLGWRRGDEIPSVFAEAVPQLSVGQVSEPIRSPSGFHLVKLIQRQGGVASGDDQAQRDRVRQRLFQRKVGDELESWTQQIRADAYVDNRLARGNDE
jgi:peptidyl-prolyl cis-trans isomerase SurA